MFTYYVIFALVLTCILEALAFLVFFRKRLSWIKYSLCCNVITNPLLNVTLVLLVKLLNALIKVPTSMLVEIVILVVLEILVVVAETYIYKFLSREKFSACLIVSIVTNLVSLLFGIVIVPRALFFILI